MTAPKLDDLNLDLDLVLAKAYVQEAVRLVQTITSDMPPPESERRHEHLRHCQKLVADIEAAIARRNSR